MAYLSSVELVTKHVTYLKIYKQIYKNKAKMEKTMNHYSKNDNNTNLTLFLVLSDQ